MRAESVDSLRYAARGGAQPEEDAAWHEARSKKGPHAEELVVREGRHPVHRHSLGAALSASACSRLGAAFVKPRTHDRARAHNGKAAFPVLAADQMRTQLISSFVLRDRQRLFQPAPLPASAPLSRGNRHRLLKIGGRASDSPRDAMAIDEGADADALKVCIETRLETMPVAMLPAAAGETTRLDDSPELETIARG